MRSDQWIKLAFETVGDLKKGLASLPDGLRIILAKDPEGNDYSPLSDMDMCCYVPESTYSGYILDEDEETEDNINAVVLWPIN